MADLSLFGSYTNSTYSYPGLILITIGSYNYSILILIQILYLFRFLVYSTELIHILRRRYLSRTHISIYHKLDQSSRRSYRAYTYTTEITFVWRYLTEMLPVQKYP